MVDAGALGAATAMLRRAPPTAQLPSKASGGTGVAVRQVAPEAVFSRTSLSDLSLTSLSPLSDLYLTSI